MSATGGANLFYETSTSNNAEIEENLRGFIIKRDGRKESIKVEKITKRIVALCHGLNKKFIDPVAIALQVISGIYYGMKTSELDRLAAEIAGNCITTHPDYALLAARIFVSNMHKETPAQFSKAIEILYNNHQMHTKTHLPLISRECYNIVKEHAELLDNAIVCERDYEYTYFGLRTLEKSYLLRVDEKIIERPQYLLMRVAIGIHMHDINRVVETYEYMSQKFFTHATPTLFSAGTPKPQLSSCFLLTMKSDSIDGIFDTIKQCALISKASGGIGLNIHCIRARGSLIANNGKASGVIPLLRVVNNVARYVDQGGGKRPGAIAAYIEPWHADIFDFLDLRKNTGKEEHRARDLFYGLWIPDLFMKRVLDDANWSLMCPHVCPGLHDVWGEEFEKLYTSYENEGRAIRTIPARTLWRAITDSQVETGTPFLLYKDSCNRKSNQQNIGTIKCSNLCTEIVQYSSPEEVAVCNLASIALNKFVRNDRTYDFRGLFNITKIITRNLNKVIENTSYPVEEARISNMRHRPLGIGVQGLADAFILMRFPYESDDARNLNIQIFETIYYAALEASCELAEKYGPYDTYDGSPVSKGILQFDMWQCTPTNLWPWDKLRAKIAQHGVRNSLLIAPMPTASTAQILGNNESFEPYTSNVYCRRVISGEFQIVNHHLVEDLIACNLWNEEIKNKILSNRGSIQNIHQIPLDIRELYKTVWEIPQRRIIRYAADRAPFIDQSQSFNIHVSNPNHAKLSSIHFYAFKLGLKTGMYYLRSLPATNAVQFTVQKNYNKERFDKPFDKPNEQTTSTTAIAAVCNRRKKTTTPTPEGTIESDSQDDGCLACGS